MQNGCSIIETIFGSRSILVVGCMLVVCLLIFSFFFSPKVQNEVSLQEQISGNGLSVTIKGRKKAVDRKSNGLFLVGGDIDEYSAEDDDVETLSLDNTLSNVAAVEELEDLVILSKPISNNEEPISIVNDSLKENDLSHGNLLTHKEIEILNSSTAELSSLETRIIFD